jgi:proline iminopeptidase
VREEPFELEVGEGVLRGDRGGRGVPALLLHGGAAVSDYTGELAAELDGLFSTVRYTQRGTPPSTVGAPYSIESHLSDALAVLDELGLERAWAIGHSWGGHLALHLLVSHPDRLLGVICIDALGAVPDLFAEADENLRRGLSRDQVARIEEIEGRRRDGLVTESDLLERWRALWPQWFPDPAAAPRDPITHIGARASIETNASLRNHFARRTLLVGLPRAQRPAVFVHGARDPLPARSSLETAALIPGAVTEIIPDAGHFPWLDRPGAVRAALETLVTTT